jgi:cytidyltransferase-like protein
MKVHTNLESLPHFKNAVLTIGSFDGVHKGHQKIIEQLRHMVEASGGESVLLRAFGKLQHRPPSRCPFHKGFFRFSTTGLSMIGQNEFLHNSCQL